MAEPLPERRLKSKAEQVADDLANDLNQASEEANAARKVRGDKPVQVQMERGYEGRG